MKSNQLMCVAALTLIAAVPTALASSNAGGQDYAACGM
jgi:hypothetical protein